MIEKERSFPYSLLGLQALQQRLAINHPQAGNLKERIRVATAGVNGERILNDVFIKYKFGFKHFIFHDLSLTSTGKFQIDTLFLSGQGAFILEVKNIAGRISFPKQWNQLVRVLDNGRVDAFECPSVQLERNRYLLEDWFQARGLSIPIGGAVVFPKSRQQIDNTREGLTILFPNEIPNVLRKRESMASVIDAQTLAYIADELLKGHTDYNPYPLCGKLHISPNDIKSGVLCEKCGTLGMTRISRGWGCIVCRTVSKTAYRQAIADWFMLKSDTMTNRDCREFLHIPNNYTATRLMGELPLEPGGESRGRYYRFPLNKMIMRQVKSPELQANRH